jgi:hypothetical protein
MSVSPYYGGPLAPAGDRLAFVVDSGVKELYTVRLDGTDLLKVSADLGEDGKVMQGFQWSSDGAYLAYRAHQDVDLLVELYSVKADGSEHNKVSGDMVLDGDVQEFSWAMY